MAYLTYMSLLYLPPNQKFNLECISDGIGVLNSHIRVFQHLRLIIHFKLFLIGYNKDARGKVNYQVGISPFPYVNGFPSLGHTSIVPLLGKQVQLATFVHRYSSTAKFFPFPPLIYLLHHPNPASYAA